MRFNLERNPYRKPGFRFQWVPFKRGSGYMAYVFPWASRNVASPRWRRAAWLSYVPGYTLTIGTHHREIRSRRGRRIYVSWTRKGNTLHDAVPGWW